MLAGLVISVQIRLKYWPEEPLHDGFLMLRLIGATTSQIYGIWSFPAQPLWRRVWAKVFGVMLIGFQ
jgi:hypothetical protein